MELTPPTLTQYSLEIPTLPLAVYREVAAHLQQVTGVTAELLPQTATSFDYLQSQIGGIQISHPADLPPADQTLLQEILDHYGNKFGPWQKLTEP
jgi:hypothetical protein